MKVLLHAPTIKHVREILAAACAELPVASDDVATRGAAVISHDVFTLVDGMLAGLLVPVCVPCAAKAKGEAA